MTDSDLVAVRTFANAIDAELARSALEAAGIDAAVRSDDAGGLHPGMWIASGVRLLVREEDVRRADAVLGGSLADWPTGE
jgi:hypothetical protein